MSLARGDAWVARSALERREPSRFSSKAQKGLLGSGHSFSGRGRREALKPFGKAIVIKAGFRYGSPCCFNVVAAVRRFLSPPERSIDSRFALYTRMRPHVGASRFEDAAIRQLIGCTHGLAGASCGETETCKGWRDQERLGVLCFCEARNAFARLAGNWPVRLCSTFGRGLMPATNCCESAPEIIIRSF